MGGFRGVAAAALAAALVGCTSAQFNTWDLAQVPEQGPALVHFKGKDVGEQPYEITLQRSQIVLLRKVAGDTLRAADLPNARLLLYDGQEVNARAARANDGTPLIAVSAKMVYVLENDPDAMAALIGHEAGHLALGHGRAAADGQAPDRSNAARRAEEAAADDFGMRAAQRGGYDPAGALSLARKIYAAHKIHGRVIYSSTHPAPEERLAAMQALAEQLRKK